jgi:hypothetical protein
MSKQTICLVALLFPVAALIKASGPDWWTDPQTRILENPEYPGDTAANYAPANLGQLKHVALQAQAHLDRNLPESAGFSVSELWPEVPPEDNYAPVNVGQLKAVAKPFYDRLIDAGYDTRQHLIDRGYPPDWEFDYPWDPDVPMEENYAPANVGQLKLVFSFDAGGFDPEDDSGENELPEWWQLEYFGETGIDPDDDADGDGQTNFQEYLAGTDPTQPDHPDVALEVF